MSRLYWGTHGGLPPLLSWAVRFVAVLCSIAVLGNLNSSLGADGAIGNGSRQQAGCPDRESALGVHRTVAIDTSSGPIFGAVTRREKEASFLNKGEVVLTFDDGPLPGVTTEILKVLARECTLATFFSVGRMALAYPATYRKIVKAGHTVGAHTYSHAANLPALPPEQVVDEIERGFAALTRVAGQPVAPFFRFPGLRDSDGILGYLQSRGIATFTVDVISNDSFIGDPLELLQKTMDQVRRHGGGIVLFHDIKHVTVRALPLILKALREEGFKVVHMVAENDYEVLPVYDGTFEVALSKARENAPGVMDIAARTGTQGILQPAAFQDALRALSGDIETGTVQPARVKSPVRARKGAWRYLPPPVPRASPARRVSRSREADFAGEARQAREQHSDVLNAAPAGTAIPARVGQVSPGPDDGAAVPDASPLRLWKRVGGPNNVQDVSARGANPSAEPAHE